MMNEHHAGQGRAERTRTIGFADIAAMAAKSDGFREHDRTVRRPRGKTGAMG